MKGPAPPCIEWGWAGSALEKGHSGDLHAVVEFDGGALVALVDGLGHGYEAQLAARAVVPIVEASPASLVSDLIRACHEGLRETRGAAMSIASFSAAPGRMTWTGVGNVDAVLLRSMATTDRPDHPLAPRPGVVGYRLPPLRTSDVAVFWGDILVMATDGVRSGFTRDIRRDATPSEIAGQIMDRHAKGTDDAHVVVARYIGVA